MHLQRDRVRRGRRVSLNDKSVSTPSKAAPPHARANTCL